MPEDTKPAKVNTVFYLMVRCDMAQGRICDMSKEDIDDTWYEDDLDDIILLAQRTCCELYKGEYL